MRALRWMLPGMTACTLLDAAGPAVDASTEAAWDAPEVHEAPEEEPPRRTHDWELRRVSRTWYVRAVRDLLGVEVPDSLEVPGDANTEGFTNSIEGLEITPLLFEAYERVGEAVVKELLRRPGAFHLENAALTPSELLTAEPDGSVRFPPNIDRWTGQVTVGEAGTYHVTFEVQLLPKDADLDVSVDLSVDGGLVHQVVRPLVPSDTAVPLTVGAEVVLSRGTHDLSLDWSPQDPMVLVMGLVVSSATISGPAEPEPNPAREARIPCDLDEAPSACIAEVVESVADRAFRRPLTDEELARLLVLPERILAEGGTPDEALAVGLRTVLAHPRFLYVVEPHRGASRPLDAWELAHRLAATVWVSLPDEALLAKAADGSLVRGEVLRAEVRRMLADPRAAALSTAFVSDWLDLERLDTVQPDPFVYPDFDEELRAAMRAEVDAMAASMVGGGRDLRSLLVSTRSTVPPRLARHYGLKPTAATEVDLASKGRAGILATGALLTMNAGPDRSSPTRRGVWVLDKLLCDPPDPPPPNVPSLPETGTNQERLEAHASHPACSGCHIPIDGIGMGFEHFDGIGAWRDSEGGQPISATATLPGGVVANGIPEIANALANDPAFPACVAEKLFTWSMGRLPGGDDASVEAVGAALAAPNSTLDDAIEALVLTPAFRAHRSRP